MDCRTSRSSACRTHPHSQLHTRLGPLKCPHTLRKAPQMPHLEGAILSVVHGRQSTLLDAPQFTKLFLPYFRPKEHRSDLAVLRKFCRCFRGFEGVAACRRM